MAAAISVIVRLEVFDAKIVSAGQSSSSFPNISFFTSRSSTTASTTMSTSASSSRVVVSVMRSRIPSRCSPSSFPFSTARARLFWIAARPRFAASSEISRTIVV